MSLWIHNMIIRLNRFLFHDMRLEGISVNLIAKQHAFIYTQTNLHTKKTDSIRKTGTPIYHTMSSILVFSIICLMQTDRSVWFIEFESILFLKSCTSVSLFECALSRLRWGFEFSIENPYKQFNMVCIQISKSKW